MKEQFLVGSENRDIVARVFLILDLDGVFMQLETVKLSILPQFFPASWLIEIPNIVYSDFPSIIRIGYVLREVGCYSYLLKDDFDTLSITLAELHAIAIQNLSNLPSGRMTLAEPPGGAEGFIASDDNFAAARILLPDVKKRFASKLGQQFLLTLPDRDWCFCWSLTQPKERQECNSAEALDEYIKNEYRLTPDILLVSADDFSLYKTQCVS